MAGEPFQLLREPVLRIPGPALRVLPAFRQEYSCNIPAES